MFRLNFLARVAVCFLFVFLPLQHMDQWFYDRFFRIRGHSRRPTQIVLVRVADHKLVPTISPHAVKSTKLPYAVWYSAFYETLLQKLKQAHPKLIVMASYYETKEGPSKANHTGILFSSLLNEENKLIPPPQDLTDRDNYGFNNLFPDPDNVLRTTRLVYSSGFSIPLRAYLELNIGPIRANLMDPIWIDYRGPAGSYAAFDAWDLFEGQFDPSFFEDKILLIGREDSRSPDLETPFGRMSRLEIHANALDTFIHHRQIQIAPRWVSLVVACFAVVGAIAVIYFFPLTTAWIVLLLASVAIGVVALILFANTKTWVGISNPLFCIFGTHLLMLGYKLGKQEEKEWRFRQETAYLREMDQFKNNFISLFSHDLKTPIAKIQAITDRLVTENPMLSKGVIEDLRNVQKINGELARFIGDILKVTKMESMPLERSTEVMDVNRLVESASQRLSFLADEKKIRLVKDLEPLFAMEGDPQLIQEVITNLIENAIKYSVPDSDVVIRTSEEEGGVRVSVRDQGEGIPPEEVPRVTGKFYRGRTMQDKVKGSGLGLYLSKYFVELHNGKLEIKSELGKGTEVSFWIPMAG